jgi:hypothetical protein
MTPRTVGRYEIEGLLGRGGMASVHRARQQAPSARSGRREAAAPRHPRRARLRQRLLESLVD